MYLDCIQSVFVKNTGERLKHFSHGKSYKVIIEDVREDSVFAYYKVKDEFNQVVTLHRDITEGDEWFDSHFIISDTREVAVETFERTVYTNGRAIRKYTGQKPRDGWFKARAIITRIEEEDI